MKKRIKKFFRRLKKVIFRPDMMLLPGQLAFFLVLAIIPTMTLVTYGASVLNLSMDFLYDFLSKAFSKSMANLMLSTSSVSNVGFKMSIALIICYYLSSNGTASLIISSNTIYGIKNGNWFKRRGKAIIMSLLLCVMLVFLLLVPIFGEKILELILNVNLNSDVSEAIYKVYIWLQSPLMWIVLFFLIKTLYVIAPDRKIKSYSTNYGTFFTTVTWILTTKIYSVWINNYADYSAFYGGLTSICVLMIWFYFLSYLFVIGMALNYQIEIEIDEDDNDNKEVKEVK